MKTLKDSIKCTHDSLEIIHDTVCATHDSRHGETHTTCQMRCIKCHMTATATRTEYNNEYSSNIIA